MDSGPGKRGRGSQRRPGSAGSSGRGRGAAGIHSRMVSSVCLICKDPFLCSKNYKGQKFACWNCRMSSAALELGFTCPITNTIMFNPTIASDNHCYERHAIQVWIATAVDNEKQPLSPVTGQPLPNLVLRADMDRLKKIQQFVIKNKLQQHPDRVEPPNSDDVQRRQTDISAQAANWLIEATPGKGGSNHDDSAFEDMAQYKTLSAKRRKEEIASGADIALAVRAARDLVELLRRLDCVDMQDTLAVAIGNAVDYLSRECVEACFYVCRERNRVVHEVEAGDELRDVQGFRSAMRKAVNGVHDQIDAQNLFKMEHYNLGVELFYKGQYDLALSVLSDYIGGLDEMYDEEQLRNAWAYVSKSRLRKSLLLNADSAFKRLVFHDDGIEGALENVASAASSYFEVANNVDLKENCYVLVMTRSALLATPENCINFNTKALKKDPNNFPALHSRARAFMKRADYKSARADLETIVRSGKALVGVSADMAICKEKTDLHVKRGHLDENELDELMAQFGLDD